MYSVAPQSSLQFSIGSDIIFNLARKSKDVYADSACIYSNEIMGMINNDPAPSFYSQKPIMSFDIVGFTVYFVGSFFNIVPAFRQIGIMPLAKDRSLFPLIVAGGQAISANPEPVAEFFDICIIGDGETPMRVLFDLAVKAKKQGASKEKFLKDAQSAHKSFYVTSLKTSKTVVEFNIEDDISSSILTSEDFVSKPRNKTIELIRGCYYKCDFCALSYMRRKAVKMPVESVIDAIKSYPEGTSIYPFAPDESSYQDYDKIYDNLGNRNLYRFNQRFNTYSKMERQSLNDSRLSFGLDGISQEIRDIVNKKITEDQIISSLTHAFSNFMEIKINLIIAFPFEKGEDWKEFEKLVNQICEIRQKVAPDKSLTVEESLSFYSKFAKGEIDSFCGFVKGKDKFIMISINPTPFQAEPHTPMQRLSIGDVDFASQNIIRIIDKAKRKYSMIKIEGLNSKSAIELEFVLKRGGRELTPCFLIMEQRKLWNSNGLSSLISPFFIIMKKRKLDKEQYIRKIGIDERLNWDFIKTGLEEKVRRCEMKYEEMEKRKGINQLQGSSRGNSHMCRIM